MAPGRSCWPAPRPMRMRPGSWTGWSRRTPRWCGCINTGPLRAVCGATRRPPRPTRRATDAPEQRTDERPAGDSASEPAVDEPGDHAIGRSRGGLTTKVHALSDGAGRLLVVLLTAGNVHDSPTFAQLFAALRVDRPRSGRPRTRPDYVVADKGYSSRAKRGLLRARGIGHTIPEKADQAANRRRKGSAGGGAPGVARGGSTPPRRGRAGGRPPGFARDRYPRRGCVERGFCQLKQWRGLATRYDKHARNYTGAINLAALLTWLP